MIITQDTYARAGIIGNPSDGYFGRTISCSVRNFKATVTLYESPLLEIKLHKNDRLAFNSMDDLVNDIKFSGYYGGIRLIKAAIKIFFEYSEKNNIKLEKKNFTISYDSNIPLRVGLAGSSAIVTSTIKALLRFYNVEIPKPELANLILSVEKDELKIGAGLQDRVIQVYEGLVYMDFNREQMEDYGYGIYEELKPKQLPNFYIAYSEDLSEGTEVLHNNIRERYDNGEKAVVEAMKGFADLAYRFKDALLNYDLAAMHSLINQNFDLRASICKISKGNWALINCARNLKASAKFCGSGGAIIGIYKDEKHFDVLSDAFKRLNASIIKPIIFEEKKIAVEKCSKQHQKISRTQICVNEQQKEASYD